MASVDAGGRALAQGGLATGDTQLPPLAGDYLFDPDRVQLTRRFGPLSILPAEGTFLIAAKTEPDERFAR